MPTDSLVFPVWRIALTAAIVFVVSLSLLRWRYQEIEWSEAIYISIVAGVSVLAWRLAGNIAPLNDDPIPAISPNDMLCPIVTWVFLGVFGGLRRMKHSHWDHARALLTLAAFLVNILSI